MNTIVRFDRNSSYLKLVKSQNQLLIKRIIHRRLKQFYIFPWISFVYISPSIHLNFISWCTDRYLFQLTSLNTTLCMHIIFNQIKLNHLILKFHTGAPDNNLLINLKFLRSKYIKLEKADSKLFDLLQLVCSVLVIIIHLLNKHSQNAQYIKCSKQYANVINLPLTTLYFNNAINVLMLSYIIKKEKSFHVILIYSTYMYKMSR